MVVVVTQAASPSRVTMASTKILGFTAILILSVVVLSYADPGHVHTKHIIHAPLHIKMIHHHKIIKVPIVFRKHLHHHKHLSHESVYIPLKEKPKPVYEEFEDGGFSSSGGGGGGGGGGDDYPKYIKSHKSDIEYSSYEGDSGESADGGGHATQSQYESHIGGGGGGGFSSSGGGYHSGVDKSEDNSYEYDDSQETGAYSKYQFHRIH